MCIARPLWPHHRREPGGGGSPRAALPDSVPGRCRAATLNRFQRPSLDAGFFIIPTSRPSEPANRRHSRWKLLRAALSLTLLTTLGAWVSGCSCFPARARPVSVQRTPAFTPPATDPDSEVRLTLLTYNVWGLPSWMNHAPKTRYATIASNLERLRPDLALMQEVWTKSALAVAPTNGSWLVAQAPSVNFFQRNGLMILSRMPIIGGDFHPFREAAFPDAMVRKGALKVTIQMPSGKRLNIWNVHLQSDAPRIRMRQILQLAGWVRDAEDGQTADLVGGDFNSTPDSTEFKLLSRELGQTAHEIAHRPFLPTYDGLSPDPKMAQTIDYLFIRPRAPLNQIEATPTLAFTNPDPAQRLSDHVALEVALRFHTEKLSPPAPLANRLNPQPVAYSSGATTTSFGD